MVPKEDDEQLMLARWLNAAEVLWFHVPNGGKRNKREAGKLRAMGVRAGVPDVMILTPPPNLDPNPPGVAIELKRSNKALSKVSHEQKKMIAKMREEGWIVEVAYGAEEAKDILRLLGYRSALDDV